MELSFAFPMFVPRGEKQAFLQSSDVVWRMETLRTIFTGLRVGLEVRSPSPTPLPLYTVKMPLVLRMAGPELID